jgi:cyclopropane-fatty-acyl-phospholipid synthase
MLPTDWIEKRLFRALEKAQYGNLRITTPQGKNYYFNGTEEGAAADITIHDWKAILPILTKGDVGLAETYRDGLWDTENLEALVEFGLQNESAMQNLVYGTIVSRLISKFNYFLRRNTLNGSKKNISAHYDLGNTFYSLWLDKSMTYSSALFECENQSLQEAQAGKYDRFLQRLDANSGRILEIGCGWGGFAERAFEKGDFELKGLTLSKEQAVYARNRLQPHGKRSEIMIEDYRIQTGTYDHIVSIEMFEAVGELYWDTYFGKLASCLKKSGKALVQTITIDEKHFLAYRNSGDMIRTFIFPGGMLPSPERFAAKARQAGLLLTDRFAFGQDYATTLRLWLANFKQQEKTLELMGYDIKFRRLWEFYLAGCAASFATKRTDVMQIELIHA